MRLFLSCVFMLIVLCACGGETEEPTPDLDATVQARVQETTAAQPTQIQAAPTVVVPPTEIPPTQVPVTDTPVASPSPTLRPTNVPKQIVAIEVDLWTGTDWKGDEGPGSDDALTLGIVIFERNRVEYELDDPYDDNDRESGDHNTYWIDTRDANIPDDRLSWIYLWKSYMPGLNKVTKGDWQLARWRFTLYYHDDSQPTIFEGTTDSWLSDWDHDIFIMYPTAHNGVRGEKPEP